MPRESLFNSYCAELKRLNELCLIPVSVLFSSLGPMLTLLPHPLHHEVAELTASASAVSHVQTGVEVPGRVNLMRQTESREGHLRINCNEFVILDVATFLVCQGSGV